MCALREEEEEKEKEENAYVRALPSVVLLSPLAMLGYRWFTEGPRGSSKYTFM